MPYLKSIFMLVLLSVQAYAQHMFAHLTTADGLSQSTVWQIVQDQKGFVWMATSDGLNRCDGYGFKVFRNQPGQENSLPISNIASVFADKHNIIWVGPRNNGLSRLNADGETFTHYELHAAGLGAAPVSVTCFAEGRDRLWLGTARHGLFYFDYSKNRVISYQNAQIGNSVTALYADKNAGLWIGTEAGKLVSLNEKTGELTASILLPDKKQNASHRSVNVILKDHSDRMWVGTHGEGLYQFFPLTKTFKPELVIAGVYETVNVITDVIEDKDMNLWVLTDYGAWFYPHGDSGQRRYILPDNEDANSLSTHALKKGLCDAQGNLWIGTWQGGINIRYAQSERFTSLQHQAHHAQSLLTDRVTAVAHDKTGAIWAGSTKGLTSISADRRHFQRFTSDNSALASNDINSLFRTPRGNVLISTWTAGLAFYDATSKRMTAFGLGKSKSVKAFAEADSGRIWVGTHERGLFLFDEFKLKIIPVDTRPIEKYLQTLDINTLCQDSNGSLWIGTYNSGLLRWNLRSGAVTHFTNTGQKGDLGSNSITIIREDSKKQLWIGTNGAGLQLFEPVKEKFVAFTTRNGLANNFIAGITEDQAGNLWLSTNGGISCFTPSKKRIENYDLSDGLVGKEFLPEACTRLSSGELAFGNMQGLVVFQPEQVRRKMPPPKIYLSGLKLFNKPTTPSARNAPTRVDITDAQTLVFSPDQSVFTIDFTAISFLPHRNIKYAYQLAGFDDDWNYVGPQRSATYTNLREGEYKFLVKAAIGYGEWSSPKVVTITILPPWFRTWWAYCLYMFVIGAVFYAWRRMLLIRERLKADVRIKQLEANTIKELDDTKTSFFTNISHEFRTPLTLILSPLERLLSEPELGSAMKHQFTTIQRNAHRLLRLVNELLDLSKLESGNLLPALSRHDIVDFVGRIANNFEELADKKHITFIYKSNFDSYQVVFDPDILEKALYNLLSNAFKFTADGGEIRVGLHIDHMAKQLLIKVEDTGIGIPEAEISHVFERFYQINGQPVSKKSGSGIGLALTRELIELHKGIIFVESIENAGTSFTITLPASETAYPAAWLSSSQDPAEIPTQNLIPREVAEGPVASVRKSPPTLLVVEDNDELRLYLKEHFINKYNVITAENGAAAIQLAEKHIPDMVLSDWLMPGMDGTELCRKIRQNEKTSHIPFLLLTSRTANQSQVSAFDTGIDDYMTKPFNLEILETKLKSLIRNRQLLREKWSKNLLVAPSEIQLPPVEAQFIQKAVAIVEQHIDDSAFDTEQLEQALNMSRMQLYRKLKGIANLSGSEFIRQIRLKRAVQLLESGHYNVSEVAWQVGFNDPAYFSRCFKKEYNKAPQEFLTKG